MQNRRTLLATTLCWAWMLALPAWAVAQGSAADRPAQRGAANEPYRAEAERADRELTDGEDVRMPAGATRDAAAGDESLWAEPPASPFERSRGEVPSEAENEAPNELPSSRFVSPVHRVAHVAEAPESQVADAAAGAEAGESLPLSPRGQGGKDGGAQNGEKAAEGKSFDAVPGDWKTMAGALAVVLGLFFLLALFAKKSQPRSSSRLPTEVLESLGQIALPGRQQLQLVRLGDKLVLLSITASGASSVAEVTDPEEVERLTGLCRQNQPGSFTNTFRRALAQFGDEPAAGGFLGAEAPASRGAATGRTRRS